MMDDELYAQLRLFANSKINGRNVWLYEVDSSIGAFQIVQWEMPGLNIEEKVFRWDYPKAEKHYKLICRKILDGQL